MVDWCTTTKLQAHSVISIVMPMEKIKTDKVHALKGCTGHQHSDWYQNDLESTVEAKLANKLKSSC
jgi:hypothetical protein